MSLNRPGRQPAEWHRAEAANYLLQANLLLDRRAHRNSAGALLYEAAKQCINAVASQQGVNPASTRAKIRQVHDLVESGRAEPYLLDNWQGATYLHVNADRGHLTDLGFNTYWEMAHTFVERMLSIYAAQG